MMESDFRYSKLKKEELDVIWNKHKKIIESFIKNNGYKTDSIYINEKSVLAIISKVDQRKKYFQYFHDLNISEFKEVALICFWYIKLKPICVSLGDKSASDLGAFEAINEKLALYYILTTFRNMLMKKNISTDIIDNLPKEYLKELIYSFEYRDISKESLILLIESIAVFLGLNPYKSINKGEGQS